MYKITDEDLEFEKLLIPNLEELTSTLDKNLEVLEGTLNMIYIAVKHSEFKANKIIWNVAGYINIVSYDLTYC